MITPETKNNIDAVLSLFETGKLPSPSAYKTCTVLADGAGISYGKHQATDRSNSLDKIVELYIERGGKHAEALKDFVPRLQANETAKFNPTSIPEWVQSLMNVLRDAGEDPIMQKAQDDVFDASYWAPAVGHAAELGLGSPLSHLVLYDTCIQSGPGGVAVIRAKFPELPPSKGGLEGEWVGAYLKARKNWLLANKNPVVQKTVYRINWLLELFEQGNWALTTPFSVMGKTIGGA